MKILTLEQLGDAVERVANKIPTNNTDTLVLGTTPSTAEGGIWIEQNTDTGVEYLAVNRFTAPDSDTAVLLHFNKSPTKDECGNTWSVDSDTSPYLRLDFNGFIQSAENLTLGDSDFTIDFFFKPATNSNFGFYPFKFNNLSCCLQGNKTYHAGSCVRKLLCVINDTSEITLTSSALPEWYHFAVVYENSTSKLHFFFNGNLISSTSRDSSAISDTFVIAYPEDNTRPAGMLRDFRISSIARWNEGFTPPSSIDSDSSTTALLRFNQSPPIDEYGNSWLVINKDGEPTELSIYTPTVSLSDSVAKFDKALFINHSYIISDYSFTFSGQPFTIDFWAFIKNSDEDIYPSLFSVSQNFGDNLYRLHCELQVNRKMLCLIVSTYSTNYVGNVYISNLLEQFIHIAVVFTGNEMLFFINGQRKAARSATMAQGVYPIVAIGLEPCEGSCDFVGFINEFRISDGVARWTQDFTPPDKPYGLVPFYSPLSAGMD